MPSGAKTAAANIGHIYGKILDAGAVAEASVMVMQKKFDTVSKKTKEVLVKGMITKGNGDFDFDQLPLMGPLKLKILPWFCTIRSTCVFYA